MARPVREFFEDLLKSKKFQYPLIHAGVKAQAALVGANGRIILDAETFIDLNLAVVIDPLHTKRNGAFWLNKALKDFKALVLRIFVQYGLQTVQHFLYSLKEYGLVGISVLKIAYYALHVGHHRSPCGGWVRITL